MSATEDHALNGSAEGCLSFDDVPHDVDTDLAQLLDQRSLGRLVCVAKRFHVLTTIEPYITFAAWQEVRSLFTERTASSDDDADAFVEALRERQLIKDAADHQGVARILRHARGIDRFVLGNYLAPLANSDSAAVAFRHRVRDVFFETYSFRGKSIVDALRTVIQDTALPSATDQIDLLVSSFAKVYHQTFESSAYHWLPTSDDVYYLTFSVLMLNTDHYNPALKVQQKLSEQDFIGSHRGTDIPEDVLRDAYSDVQGRQIMFQQPLQLPNLNRARPNPTSDWRVAYALGPWQGVAALRREWPNPSCSVQ